MTVLNKEALLKKEKLEVVKVDLDKGDYVYVRQMTGRERDTFERSLFKEVRTKKGAISYEGSLKDFRAKLAVCTLCDEKGVLLLSPADVSTLSQNMSAFRLEIIINEAQKLNKISEEDKEEILKNLNADPVGNSSSDSVEN